MSIRYRPMHYENENRMLKQDLKLVLYLLQESWLLPTERASAVKTRMNGLSCGEKNHDNTFSRFDTIPACDRQTD